jgi:hypothetical protein
VKKAWGGGEWIGIVSIGCECGMLMCGFVAA